MQKKQSNFKDLKGTLTRDEMKKVKGGGDVVCTICPTNPITCYDTFCTPPHTYCGLQLIGTDYYYCICDGDC